MGKMEVPSNEHELRSWLEGEGLSDIADVLIEKGLSNAQSLRSLAALTAAQLKTDLGLRAALASDLHASLHDLLSSLNTAEQVPPVVETKQVAEPKTTPEPKSAASTTSVQEDFPTWGVQLKYLRSLSVEQNGNFHDALALLADTASANESHAEFLIHTYPVLIQQVADVYVSYPWSSNFHSTLQSLADRFNESSTFVWMDFICLPQSCDVRIRRQYSPTSFVQQFQALLKKVHTCVFYMAPGHSPVALERTWCVFEWVTCCMAAADDDQNEISYEMLLPAEEKFHLLEHIHNEERTTKQFTDVLSKCDLHMSMTTVEQDKTFLLERLVEQMGDVASVESILKSLMEEWLAGLLMEADTLAFSSISNQGGLKKANSKRSLAALYQALGKHSQAITLQKECLELARSTCNRDFEGRVLTDLGAMAMQVGDTKQAQVWFQQALDMIKAEWGDDSRRYQSYSASVQDMLLGNEALQPTYSALCSYWTNARTDRG